MDNGDELRSVLLEILREGLLRIRVFGWAGQADQCAVEADHLHNLPELIRNPRLRRPEGHLAIGREVFIEEGTSTGVFRPLWNRLESILEAMRSEPAGQTR